MALPGLDPTPVGLDLSRQVGGFGGDEAWVQMTLRLFDLPTVAEAFPLFKAFRRITVSAPWICLSEAPGELQARLDRILQRLADRTKTDRVQAFPELSGDFGMAGAIVGSDASPRPVVENLRATLWFCLTRWAEAGDPRWSAAKVLMGCIRNITKVRDTAAMQEQRVARLLLSLTDFRSLPDFIEQAQVLKTCGQKNIQDAWARHFEDELLKFVGRVPAMPPGPQPLPPKGPRPSGKKPERDFDEDEAIDDFVDHIRRVQGPSLSGTFKPAEGEPANELASEHHVCPVETRSTNPDAKRMAVCRARQAIWGQNQYLLTNHPDVLPLNDLRDVIQVILTDLKAGNADPSLQLGLTAALLQAITGRTAKTLGALRVVDHHEPTLVPGRIELCPRSQMLRLGVFWKECDDPDDEPSFFRPKAEQASLLEPVADTFFLPLSAAIAGALLDNRDSIDRLVTMKPEALAAHLRAAARRVSERLGLAVAAGQIRRSLAAHTFEQCRDTALTQLICMDSLGQSTNPLNYYAPTRATIAGAYWDMLRNVVPCDEPMPAIEDAEARVGGHLLLREAVARAMANAPSGILQSSVEQMLGEGEAWKVHQAMVNHLACMLLALVGHRPVDALFELTVGEIHPASGLALFLDKIIDPAHDPRLVALPTCVREQLSRYCSHLRGLAGVHPRLASHVRRVLAGQQALLFHITPKGHVWPLTMQTWKPTLPEVWRSLPLNWGRTWIRTRGTELGLPPELASIELGHLEAVGYPFSNGGPTEPEAFGDAIRPFLDRMAKLQGWRVRTGIPWKGDADDLPLSPLRPWAGRIAKHEQAIRDRQKNWRLELRSRMKSCRQQAEQDVLAHLALVKAGITDAFASKTAKAHTLLSREQAEAVRDELFDSAEDDVPLGLARADALRRILKRVNKRAGVTGQEPARLVSLRRPVDNAFVPGMLLAYRQVQALREWMIGRSGKKPDNWRDFPRACARTALAMALFGFFGEADEILAVLENRSRCVRSAVLDDTLFVPTGESEAHPLVVRDLAALAVGKLAKKYRNEALPTREAINAALENLLPEWSLPKRREQSPLPDVEGPLQSLPKKSIDLLERLCQTVSVCNRIELSPAARLVMDGKRGSVSAHLREQLALIDGDPVGTLQRDWETSPAEEPVHERRSAPPTKGGARSQYNALCAILPSAGKDLALVRSGKTIASGQLFSAGTRAHIIGEVRLMLDDQTPQHALQPIVRLLATWVLQMLEEGTQNKVDPADRTIETYLNRIGGGLVETLGTSSLASVDGAELEDAYLLVVSANESTADKAAAAILDFHDCGFRRFGLPELDLTEIRAHLSSDRRLVDAHLILPAERDEAIRTLAERAEQDSGVDARSRGHARAARQARVALPFYAFGGARRSEVLGTRFSDMSFRGGPPRLRIRANRSRRLKTRAARRIVELPMGIAAATQQQLARWIETDRSRLQDSRSEHAFIFSPLDAPRSATGRNEIAAACHKALAQATGRASERLHRLRHLVAFERVTPLFLSWEDGHRLNPTAFGPIQLGGLDRVVLPRDMMAEVITLGHAQWSTTLICYHHLPWLLLSRPQSRISRRYFHRRAVASILGVAQSWTDGIVQAAKDVPDAQAWFDSVQSVRKVPRPRTVAPRVEQQVQRRWSACELGALLDRMVRMGSLEAAIEATGGHGSEADRIRLAAAPFEQRLGRRLLDASEATSGLPKRVARKPARDHVMHGLWKSFDEDIDGIAKDIGSIALGIYDWMQPKDADRIRMPSAVSDKLMVVLRRHGTPAEDIRTEQSGSGLCTVRLDRKRSVRPSTKISEDTQLGGYLGIALKRVFGVIWLSMRLRDEGALPL